MKISLQDLRPKQKKFLIALMETDSITEAALVANISVPTAYRYNRDPTFKKAQSELMAENMKAVARVLLNEIEKSITVIAEVRDDEESPVYARLTAAKTLIDNMFKAYNVTDTVERIERIEEWHKELTE